jgi:hypothetical protein
MDYTLSRDATGRFCDVTRWERNLLAGSLHDTRAIAHLSVLLRCAVSVCLQPLFIPQHNDIKRAKRYLSAARETKSLCITMGFCFTKWNISELSGVPQQAGERL